MEIIHNHKLFGVRFINRETYPADHTYMNPSVCKYLWVLIYPAYYRYMVYQYWLLDNLPPPPFLLMVYTILRIAYVSFIHSVFYKLFRTLVGLCLTVSSLFSMNCIRTCAIFWIAHV